MPNALDLINHVFGDLTVIKRHGLTKRRNSTWQCKCECGNFIVCSVTDLKQGKQNCGCKKHVNTKPKSDFIDETGKTYGKLVVIEKIRDKSDKHWKWLCRCECGNFCKVTGGRLRRKETQSCGCLKRLPYGVSAFRATYGRIKKQASERGYTWNLTEEEFRIITSQPCNYCGTIPKQNQLSASRYKRHNGVYIYNGIDRIDNTDGYYFKNCVPCCKFCNRAKSAMNAKEFRDHIINIYNHWANVT